MTETPRAAALLLRISDDRNGDAAGVGRQDKDGRALAERLGWPVALVVDENDTSAFKRRKTVLPDGSTAMRVYRPKFRNLLDLIKAGQIDALIAYDLDRVARDPRDLEDLIDVVEATRIPVVSVTGSLSLADDAGITMARVMVALANKSSRDSSRRISRKQQELAEQGRPTGGVRRFGFAPNGIDHDPAEAEVIRWCAEQVLAGCTVSSLTKELDAKGVKPVKAKKWSAKTLSDLLVSPRIAGQRVYQGKVVGKAAWEPIIDAETYRKVEATITARARGKVQPKLVRWCNRLLFCGRCGHAMTGATAGPKRPPNYWCDPRFGGCGKLSITAPRVEEELQRQIHEWFVEYGDRLTKQVTMPPAVPRLPTTTSIDVVALQNKRKKMARMFARDEITEEEWLEARAEIEERLQAARPASVVIPTVPPQVRDFFTGGDVAARWDGDIAPELRREIARTILGVRGYKGWRVLPASTTGPRRFNPDRLWPVEAEGRTSA